MPPPTKQYPPTRPCLCFSGLTYAQCCAPLHRGEREADDQVAMMRSRFCAFAVGEIRYLYRTLHSSHEDKKRPEPEILRELREASSTFRYMGLTILDSAPADDQGVARVLFLAKLFERGQDRSFYELSDFRHDGTGWRYVAGATIPARLLRDKPEAKTIADFRAMVR